MNALNRTASVSIGMLPASTFDEMRPRGSLADFETEHDVRIGVQAGAGGETPGGSTFYTFVLYFKEFVEIGIAAYVVAQFGKRLREMGLDERAAESGIVALARRELASRGRDGNLKLIAIDRIPDREGYLVSFRLDPMSTALVRFQLDSQLVSYDEISVIEDSTDRGFDPTAYHDPE